MDNRIKGLWLDALRSGEYEQGAGQLRNTLTGYNEDTDSFEPTGEFTYCCLGVLCDLYAKENDVEWHESDLILDKGAFPPNQIAIWAGLNVDQKVGLFGFESGEPHDVVSMNDRGESFETIADIIERSV